MPQTARPNPTGGDPDAGVGETIQESPLGEHQGPTHHFMGLQPLYWIKHLRPVPFILWSRWTAH